MATKKGFIDTTKQKKDSSSVVHVYSDMHRDRYSMQECIHVIFMVSCAQDYHIMGHMCVNLF